MLLLTCPHCGPRPSDEFTHRGEIVPRPEVSTVSPDAWRAYLYERANEAGPVVEEWFHGSGCRRFLVIERDTVTNEIASVRDRADR
ncbi:MAG: sarcosine oxidase subunit delta [Acidimicrobiia bacterium]|nr:sarcosine oxidase subunit delta [Acidimicrobiia bacterium]